MLAGKARFVVLALISAPLVAQTPAAPTADEIVAKYVDKVGGIQKIEAVKTLKRTGKYHGGGGFEAKFVELNKRPDLVREELTFQGMTGVNAWDGKTGWKIEPWQGKKDPEPLGEDELKDIIEDSDFDGPLVRLQGEGQHDRVRRHRAGRRHRRLEAQGDAEERGRVLLLHGHRVPGPDQDRTEADDSRRRAGDRDLSRETTKPSTAGTSRTPSSRGARAAASDPRSSSRRSRPTCRSTIRCSPSRRGPVAVRITTMKLRTLLGIPSALLFLLRARRGRADETRLDVPPVKVDSETISRPRRPQHRPGGDERPHRGDRRRARGRTPHHLRRRRERRRLEVGRRRHDLQAGLRQAAASRSARSRSTPRTRRPSGWAPARRGRATASRSATASTRPPTAATTGANVGLEGLRAHREDRRRPEGHRHRLRRAPPGKLWSDSDERGVYKTTDGGKTLDEGPLGRQRRHRLLDDLDRSAEPEDALRRHVAVPAQGLDVPLGRRGPEAPSAAASTSPPTAARPGRPRRDPRRACPPKPWGRIAVAVAPSKPNVVYAFVEAATEERPSTAPTTAARPGSEIDRSQSMIVAALLLRPPDRRSEGRQPRLQAGPDADRVSNDGGKSFRAASAAARTATSTTLLDQPAQHRPPDRWATTAASSIPTTAATHWCEGGRTCRSRSSTT